MANRKILTFILPALALMAQQPAAIHGVVTDPSGAPVPAAAISLTGENFEKAAQTAADGSYSFAGIVAGDYTLKADYPGLEPYEGRITAAEGKTLELPIRLRLRVSSQTVTVTEDRGPELSLDPGSSASTTTVTGAALDALPDNPDDLNDMLQALTGPLANGPIAAQILVDGFSGGQLPAKSLIKEIKIDQAPFSASGNSPFGQVEIVTNPGSDKFHGSLGATDSDAIFNSRNPFASNKADYLNRMFTGNAVGAINKKASYTFDFYQNTINNTALIDAVTLAPVTLAEVPIRSSVVIPRDDISGTARLDYQISANHSFTGSYRYLLSNRDDNGVGQYSLESRGFSSKSTTGELRLKETAVLSASVVSETRFGFTRVETNQYGDTTTPSLIVAGSFNSGSAQIGRTTDVNSLFELQSNTTVIHKAHTVKVGGRLRYNPIKDIAPTNFGGTFSFFGVTNAPVLNADNQPVGNETADISSLEQYRRTLLFESMGYSPSMISALGGGASQFSIAAGNPLVKFSQTDGAVYINDDWRASPNLSVTLGLRYEVQTRISDYKDFGPRFAFAWSPGAKKGAAPKTVIRGGSGMFYDRLNANFSLLALHSNGTSEQQYVVQNPDFFPNIPPISSLVNTQPQTTFHLDPDLKAAASLFSQISVERQLPGKTSVAVTYNNQRTAHSFYRQAVDINAPLAGTFAAGAPVYPYGQAAGNIFEYESNIVQKVQWVAFHVNSKVNQKISLSVDYSIWDAHNDGDFDPALPNGITCYCSYPSNPYNLSADWGRASWSAHQNVNAVGSVMAPGGIQFSPFLIAASGHPYNLTIGSDLNGDTVANDRPSFATDLSRPSVVFTKFGAFDTDPLPGQTIVPRNYLTGAPMWLINLRVSKSFGFGKPKEAAAANGAKGKGPAQHRYGLNFNIDANNILNHLNPGGYVGSLSSPLFGQATAMNNGFRDTSNNRKVQFGTQFTF